MKTLITKDLIASLKPCKDRYDNYLKFYGDRSLTKGQFMGLKNIRQDDKMWVAFRLMPKENLVLCVADIAESVLHIFEEAYPNDKRPREAIAAARSGDKALTLEVANAAYAAADAAIYADADAANAAYAAYAACVANYSATYADADAANAAYAAYAACVANYSATYAADAANAAYAAASTTFRTRPVQEKLIRKIVLKYWKG